MRGHELHQKLQLVQQLKQLSRQHEQVLAAYERKVEEKLQTLPSGSLAGGKRAGPPLIAEGPDAKRQRQLAERDRRKKELWDEVVKIVEKIRKNPKSEAFRIPVDPIKLKIPDYFKIIQNPMDIGTVLKKLRSQPRQYSSPAEVADDMRLIWHNCRTYNGEKHVVTANANILSESFEKFWGQANIEHKWQVEMKREEREDQAFAEHGADGMANDNDLVTQLRSRRNMLGDLIAAKDVQENLPPGALGELAPDRDMTFEEKRKLSAHMASIPGEKLTAVLEIIEECEDLPSDDEQERELDMDCLNNSTLWKLKAYVDGILTATTGPPPKKTAANRASGAGAPNKNAAGAHAAHVAAAAAAAAAAGSAFAQPAAAASSQQQQPQQPQPSAVAMPPPAAAGDGQQQQQHQQLLQQQQQQQLEDQQQQSQSQSPTHSAGVSADEVVASTAPGGAGTRSVHHTLGGDPFTVAQSGTNARPSNFVKSKPRPMQPPGAAAGDAAKPSEQPTAMDADVNADWNALVKEGEQQQQDGNDAAAAAPAAGAAAGGATKSEGEDGGGDAAAAGPAAAAAVAVAGEDMWDEFAGKAKQEEEKLAKQREEEERKKREEEERTRKLEELQQQKERERLQEQQNKQQQTVQELIAAGAKPAGAAAENKSVQDEIGKLRGSADAVAMDVDGVTGGDDQTAGADEDDEDDEDSEEGDADDGKGFD